MNYHELFRKLEFQLSRIESQPSLNRTIGKLIENLLADFSIDLGLAGARLYALDEECQAYRLIAKFGADIPAPIGYTIPLAYNPIQVVLHKGIAYMELGSQGVDPKIEGDLGVERFAAITVGPEKKHLIAFTVEAHRREEVDDVLFALSSIRHAINFKLAQEKLESVILQSREIQLSLLPEGDVRFEGFDIAGRSQPAELVGGDLYDFLHVSPKILGIAIGDATGHGLPAALQARDVIMGLRMGISEDQKMVKVFERLNRVIHSSQLTSRYVSLFYGELEVGGHLIFVNAGHNPPFYYRLKKDRFYPLEEGGRVLGPTSDATYRRGFYKIDPGDAVLFYTDGITEAMRPDGEQFGEARVQAIVRENVSRLSSREMAERILQEVADYSRGGAYLDDRTVVFLKRLY
jgi:sigma-B regulation protein RsbU (phosphoserine phosphatase)